MQDNDENKETTENKNEYPEPFTMESYQRIWEMRRQADKEWKTKQEQWKLERINRYREEKGLPPLESLDSNEPERLNHVGDSFNALDNAPATILYIFVMIAGSIFNDRVWIWIIATFIWLKHIFRMEIKKDQIRKEEEERMRRK
jgi:hypothetical protein